MASVRPWEKKKWRGGEIRPCGAVPAILSAMGIVFLAIGMAAALNAENALKLPPNKENIVLLFPVVGLCLTASAIFMFLRNRKWRGSKFVMKTMPGVIGGRLSGVLLLSGDLGQDADINITLVNEESRTRSSGKKSHTSTHWLFKHEMQVNSGQASRATSGYALQGIGQIEVPVDVEIPFETKDETDNHRSGSTRYSYKWKLKVKADIPGMDLNLEFVLPIYRTEASDPTINLAKKDTADAAAAVKAHQAGRLDFQEIKTDRVGGSEHYVSRGGSRALFAFGFIFLSIGIGIAYFSIMKFLPQFHENKFFALLFLAAPIVIAGVFVLVGSLLAMFGVFSMGTKEVWVQDGRINYIKRLGSKQWSRTIGRDYIIDIAVKKCGSSGGNNFYAVRIEHSDLSQLSGLEQFFCKKAAERSDQQEPKATLEIARDIDDKAEAHLLAEKIKQQLGLTGVAVAE
ncbi:MAG: hypothetical protein DRP66_04385 [Planctomycetota bacterium]|nr:MAG: hypothetical protein DRP66_04385 [Planctomycetota bacterium]